MSYKCINKECSKYNIEVNPGGRLTFKEGKLVFTGSKCNNCGNEMEKLPNKMPTILNIKNDSDGRNL